MKQFMHVVLLENEAPAYVNKQQIRFLTPIESGGTRIQFDSEDKVEVADEYGRVIKLIEES